MDKLHEMSNSRAKVDPADAVLLLMVLGVVTLLMREAHDEMIIVGAMLAYAALIVALVILPRKWFNDDN